MQTAPKQFVFLPVLQAAASSSSSGGGGGGGVEARVTRHLNDFFSIAHWHDPEDGLVNLDEANGWDENEDDGDGDEPETASMGSVMRRDVGALEGPKKALISESVCFFPRPGSATLVDAVLLLVLVLTIACLGYWPSDPAQPAGPSRRGCPAVPNERDCVLADASSRGRGRYTRSHETPQPTPPVPRPATRHRLCNTSAGRAGGAKDISS